MKFAILTTAVALFATDAVAQEEQVLAMKDVPQAARDAAMSHANGATFEKVAIDEDEGTRTYEFSAKLDSGMMFEVDVLEDGTVEEIEEQIEMGAVPAAVSAKLSEEVPGFAPAFIEKSTRPGANRIVYEFEGEMDGKEIDIEIDEDGSNYTMNDDTAA